MIVPDSSRAVLRKRLRVSFSMITDIPTLKLQLLLHSSSWRDSA